MRDIGLPELKGFRKALLELAVPFNVDGETIDLCGTGGDGKNISISLPSPHLWWRAQAAGW